MQMSKMRSWFDRTRTLVSTLAEAARKWLDENAERDKQGWGARMEYKRRYTNPDSAKKARTPVGSIVPGGTKK